MNEANKGVNDQYSKILQENIMKFGDMSMGVLMVRLHFLIHLIKTSQFQEKAMNEVLQKIIEQYNYENMPESSLQKYIRIEEDEKTTGKTYVFDESYFRKTYSDALPDASLRIKKIDSIKDIDPLEDSSWYIYTVSQENELIIYDAPMSISELVLNRNTTTVNGVQIVHPILVHDKELKIRTAGEICFIKDKDSLKGVILNTKSGHYRPDPFSYDITESILVSNLGLLPAEIIKIPVGLKRNQNAMTIIN